MEEIKQTKKTITSIFETNDKVFKIIQELKAAHEEQGRRIHGLEGSFQGLEKRIREGDKEIRELESMVLDLGPNLKQAAKTIEINTGPLVEERRRSQYLGIVEGGRESDLQPADGCSNIPLRLDGNMTESTNITPEYKEQVTCIVPYISHNRTNRQPVTYTENSDVNSVDSQISYQNRKVEPFGNHGKSERCDSQNLYPLTEKPVNDASFKGKLTKIADDNRLHYQRKIEMNKRRNKQKV
ncbi:uncharacterized protein LOC117334179, partial [Pecten maximus]|uniref:uncharacterized protein LOC117334179 n=1 Tax=Pecten maximus TaxID=6579 RepID=UPI001458A041